MLLWGRQASGIHSECQVIGLTPQNTWDPHGEGLEILRHKTPLANAKLGILRTLSLCVFHIPSLPPPFHPFPSTSSLPLLSLPLFLLFPSHNPFDWVLLIPG